jgi:hypothetical protein
MELLIENCILSYPSLGKPVKSQLAPDQPPRFKADFIITDPAQKAKIEAVIAEKIASDFGGNQPKNLFLKTTANKIDKDTGLALPLYDKGDSFMTPWSGEGNPPALLSPQAKPNYAPQNFKGGNIVNVLINIWTSDKFGGTIGAGLSGVQWAAEGNQVTPTANLNLFKSVPATKPTAEGFTLS